MHAHMLQLRRDNGLSCTFFGYNSLENLHSKARASGPGLGFENLKPGPRQGPE